MATCPIPIPTLELAHTVEWTLAIAPRWVKPAHAHGRPAKWRLLAEDSPTDASELESRIADSDKLLKLHANWDDEGAPPVSAVAHQRAITFLRSEDARATQLGGALAVPRIGAGPDGSIDLHWLLDTFEILLNFPASATEPATFYGDDGGGGLSIKGTISEASTRSLLPWLIKL